MQAIHTSKARSIIGAKSTPHLQIHASSGRDKIIWKSGAIRSIVAIAQK
jgi:hypothetical protein